MTSSNALVWPSSSTPLKPLALSSSNAPQIMYVIKGRGVLGIVIPGCPETLQGNKDQDRHQKINYHGKGDIVAVPGGLPIWLFNNGSEDVVALSVLGTTNSANQLDMTPRRFYLAGNPEDEFPQQHESRFERGQQQYSLRRPRQRQQGSCNNLFCVMGESLISEAFDIDSSIARKLRGENDNGGNIVKVRDKLNLVKPISKSDGEREEKQKRENPRGGGGRGGCYDAAKLEMNGHSISYVTRGSARVQVVNEKGRSVFDGNVTKGQVLVVPQDYVAATCANSDRFEHIVLNTNGNAKINPVVGRTRSSGPFRVTCSPTHSVFGEMMQ
ncbi:legumin A-like [Hevea brasiliensis]|uniref:legumin A-like n=1 Tax=Hevea brasiliensis TaxID=3981 RepID=UPI0025CBEAA8|nr:legumin A-like [Hevea brasiliensis]